MRLQELKGIGPKTEKLFQKVGVMSAEDLIRYYPVHYDEYLPPVLIGEAAPGAKMAVRGTVVAGPAMRRTARVTVLTAEIADRTGKMKLVFFNAPYLAGTLKRGSTYIFRGIVTRRGNFPEMEHPEIIGQGRYEEIENTLVPVYSLTKGLTGKTVAKAVREAFDALSKNGEAPGLSGEYLPESLVHLHGLLDEKTAVRAVHFPENREELGRARERLAFDEFFLFVLAMRQLRMLESEVENAFPMKKTWAADELIEKLPYQLTGAQMRVWREIERDLAGKKLMSRLLQGDVGSGKTIIAFLAMVMAADNGYQSALMAPTEVLARQHYEKLCHLKETCGIACIHPVLLTGSVRAAERRDVLERIRSGAANAVIGTHALIQSAVMYQSLALVITDEQHRFGVRQRKMFGEKAAGQEGTAQGIPNAMVMSATPIPRTLGVIMYGDLDVSVLDERPARRLPIRNAVVDETFREAAWRFIEREIRTGRQAYVICPMIEPGEGMPIASVTEEIQTIRKRFPDIPAAELNGRMKPGEKNRVMQDFLEGHVKILVSTTVVEVGVDVPNATVMLIENAERFGLATLHQLRGRVGRGQFQSYCIFMAGVQTDEIRERLDILRSSDDGFKIAEKDFELRGPGDLLGVRQSGDALFKIADVNRDRRALKLAGETAAAVMADDPELIHEEDRPLREKLEAYMSENERNIVL